MNTVRKRGEEKPEHNEEDEEDKEDASERVIQD